MLSQRGHGAQGVVYEALDLQRDLHVALKTLNLRKPEDVLRFKNEFRIVRDLHHPNLIRLGELLQDAGRWFYTMELVDGEDLLTYVRPGGVKESRGDVPAATVTSRRKNGQSDSKPVTQSGPTISSVPPTVSSPTVEMKMAPGTTEAPRGGVSSDPGRVVEKGGLDEGRLRKSLRSLASVVSFLHRAGKVHRDLKPSNILVDERGRLVLIDFGVTGELAEQQDDRGLLLGTVLYMAPEQTRGGQIGPEADWYALGVLIFQALTGKRPFEGKHQDVILCKTTLDAPRPSELVPGVPADLDELCARLLERDPAHRPQESEILRALGVDAADASDPVFGSPTLFVGRATELTLLGDAFVNVRAGRPATIVLEGESGAGKSAIAARFIEEARAIEPRVLVLRGRCHEQERVPYNAFDAAVDAIARHLRGLPEARRARLVPPKIEALQRIFPSLKVLAGSGDEVDPQWDGRTLRSHAFAALRELLVRIAQKRPVVLLLDDLQWADADSIALIAELVRTPDAAALLLLATARPDARGASCPAVESLGTAIRRVPVRGLEPAEAAELVGRCAELHGLASAATAAILDETRGHPMFIDELVRHLAAAGGDGGTSTVALDEALWRRSQALGDTTRDLLHLVSTAGAQVPQRLLAEAAGIAPSALAEPIAELRKGRFVRVSGVRPEDGIEPYHDRVRESVLAHLSGEIRRDCHGRLARALTTSGAADPEALALHWRGAGDSVEAARWAERAADRAADALAFDRAAELYRLALVGHVETDRETLSLRSRLADALARAGRGREAAEAYLAASLLSEGDTSLALQHRAAEQLLYSGRIDDGLKLLRPVLAQNGMPMPSSKAGTLLSLLSMRARMRLRGDGFKERAVSAIDPERLRRLDEVYSIALGLCWVDVMPGLVYQARHFLLALDAGEPYRASCALSLEAGVVATMKKMQRAELMLARADELANRSGQPRAKAMVMGVSGFVALAGSRFDEALGHFETARSLLRERCHGVAWEIATCETNLLFCLMLLGRYRELRERGQQWTRDAEERGNLFAVASMYAGPMPHAKLGENDPDGADHLIADAMARWSQQGFHLQHVYQLSAASQVAIYRGDPAAAHALHVDAAEKLGRSLLLRVQIVRLMVNETRARAAVALAATNTARRKQLQREARRLANRLAGEGVALGSLNGAIVRAGLAYQEGDRAGTETYLREALRYAEEAHMKLYAAAIRWRLGELRGGDAGRSVIATARAEFEKEGVVDCERLASSFTPGFSPLRAG